jgi:DMSO/TMAO reductase YedYZ molybdopterin-dependent catalytic subunit
MAVAELAAGLSDRTTPPVIAVGNRVVDAVPRPVKDLAIDWFGTSDKVALLVGIGVLVALAGAAIGVVARRHLAVGVAGIAAFGVVGVWAAGAEVDAPWWAGLPAVLGAVVGSVVLVLLVDRLPHRVPATTAADGTSTPPGPLTGRRGFLAAGGAAAALALVAATSGRWLQGRFSAASSRLAVVLPRPRRAAPALDPEAALAVPGLSPFLTPNRDFYRIDTNLTVPQLPAEQWTLKVTGLVDRELEISYADLLERDLVEERITMTCVSNEVGGALVGTATWLGLPLRALLDEAGVQPEAEQLVGRAFDGFTTGFPVELLDGDRPALLAVGMNGEPLPLEHGFPARVVVSGLYGYLSATKWITELELTTFDALDPYWVQRDWDDDATIDTMARIDVPRGLQQIAAGSAVIAGVAWAQTRGITGVEVQIDDGPWQPARLAAQDSTHTWRQWVFEWDAEPGRHQVACRATDGTGERQTDERARPFPSGATGHHSIAVLVS